MKQLQVLVVSDQQDSWENTDRVRFQYYFPAGHYEQQEKLSWKWDYAILDETVLGYSTANAIAQKLNLTHDTPIIYLVDSLEYSQKEKGSYHYSIGFFHKSSDGKSNKGGLDTFIQLIASQKDRKVKDAVFVFEKDNFYQKIPIHDILWIEALKNGCKIITMRRPYTVSVTLQEFEQRFRHPSIVRIHDEYLVNITKVSGFDSDHTVIHQSRLPLSMAFRRSITEHFNLI
ncbi:MAG: LytR/AlgR family response regulator transcription factor [Flammeovirgaceae bacterium]